MATVGQIIYALDDGNGHRLYTNKSFSGITTTPSDALNIYNNVCTGVIKSITKLGIQAAPGTKVKMGTNNNEQEILIGRTGIYELEEGLVVEKLYFIPPTKYAHTPGSVQDRLDGQKAMEAATEAFNTATKDLDTESEEAAKQYNEAKAAFQEAYQLGYDKYMKGVIGTYTEVGNGDLSNVIIDFIY